MNEQEVPVRTSDVKCLDLIRTWLDGCNATHAACKATPFSQQVYPKRLLDIGLSPDGVSCRLRTTDTKDPREPYCTLSHCWGQEYFLHLTSRNLAELTQAITVSSLSKTFQDAISVTKSLGIRYLWIDALCIIQDSLEDWEHEAPQMSGIYTQSYCNIAALDAVRGEGCFANRVVSMVQPCLVRDCGSLNDKKEIYAIIYDDFWSINLLKAPLHQRGWVLQERLLSPRTIHFGCEQIFWECHHKLACETYPSGIPIEFINARAGSWRLFDTLSRTRHQNTVPLDDKQQVMTSSPYELWSKTVERFMECKLTQPRDKLVAIAGIAQRIAEVTQQKYLAGLWMNEELALQLLWYVLTRRQADDRPSERPAYYRAPSWSWACIDAKIVWGWPTDYGKVLATITEASTEAKPGEDIMCEVTGARLKIRGCIFEAGLEIARIRADGTYDEDGTYKLLIEYDETDEDGRSVKFLYPIVGADIHLDTSLAPLPSLTVHCLPICTNWTSKSGKGTFRVAGLLLSRVEATESQYTRLGIFGLDTTKACHFCGLDSSNSDKIEEVLETTPQETILIV